jgi:hypothetical protein
MAPEQHLPGKLLSSGDFREQRLHRRRGGDVHAREHPAGRALKHLDESGLLHQLRDDLDRAGAGADHGDPFAGEIVVGIPAGAVDLVALEAVQAADVGEAGVRQRARGQHDGAGTKTLAVLGRCGPHAGVLVERQPIDLVFESDMTTDVEFRGHLLDVPVDLRRGGVRT